MAVNHVNLSSGEELIDLRRDTVIEDTLPENVTAHNAKGEQIVGKFPISEVDTQAELIEQIKTALDNKTAGSGGAKEEQTKTLDVTENGTYMISPDEGKVLSSASVNVNVPLKAEQEKSVNILQNGTVEVVPDEGKTLSKVTVETSVASAGGAGNELFNSLIKKTITRVTEADFQGATIVPRYIFYQCRELESVDLPEGIVTFQTQAFSTCSKLPSITIPASVQTFESQIFFNCDALTSVTFKGTPTGTIYGNIFNQCDNLTVINVPWSQNDAANANAPWGAPNTNVVINYNYAEGASNS